MSLKTPRTIVTCCGYATAFESRVQPVISGKVKSGVCYTNQQSTSSNKTVKGEYCNIAIIGHCIDHKTIESVS